jgi:hypothetical protein
MNPEPLRMKNPPISLLAFCLTLAVTGCQCSSSSSDDFSIRVVLAETSISAGTKTTAKAQRLYEDGRVVDLDASTSLQWASSEPQVASVEPQSDGTVQVTALKPGSALITVNADGASGEAALEITDARLLSLQVSPTTASVPVGSTQQFTAQGSYSGGTTADVTSNATWTTSNTAITTVSNMGLATGVAGGGPVTLTATLGGVSGTAQLSVTGWTSAGAMSTSRYNHTATRLDSGRVLIAGGRNGTTTLSSVELSVGLRTVWLRLEARSAPNAVLPLSASAPPSDVRVFRGFPRTAHHSSLSELGALGGADPRCTPQPGSTSCSSAHGAQRTEQSARTQCPSLEVPRHGIHLRPARFPAPG